MVYRFRYQVSFILTLLLFAIFITFFYLFLKNEQQKPNSRSKDKIRLSLSSFKLPNTSSTPLAPAIKKVKEVKKSKKVENIKKLKKVIKKIEKKNKKKSIIKKSKVKKELLSKNIIPKNNIRPNKNKDINLSKISKKDSSSQLISFLKKPSIPSLQEIGKKIENQEINRLYKGEFDSFTKNQKEFIKKNLSQIGKITQKYLYLRGYPKFAVKTKQDGVNIVEFYLYPNGDISDLKIKKSSNYSTLDQNSLDTILVAYKDYPRPKEKTKIIIYVKYEILY